LDVFVDNHDVISLKLYDIGVDRKVLHQLLYIYAAVITFLLENPYPWDFLQIRFCSLVTVKPRVVGFTLWLTPSSQPGTHQPRFGFCNW